MSKGNWGGSAGGGGFEFQSAVSALCMVYMARGAPLGWLDSGHDIPLSVSAETGGGGDDIALQLTDGSILEIQAKRKLQANAELWGALLALCRRANNDVSFHGVLAVGPTTSVAIRDQLARDIIRLGQGREDDLSPHAVTFAQKLKEALIPLPACGRVRIQTLHLLEQDGASAQSALAQLAHVTSQPDKAWERLRTEGLRLIKLRGRQDAISIAGIIPGLRENASGPIAPALIANQFLEWVLRATGGFTIPAVDKIFSLDDHWIELKAYLRDTEIHASNIEEALTNYHEGYSRNAKPQQSFYNAESLGYFVRHCVVVAGPGMGKTLLLRRIARLLARKREPALLVRLRPLAERMQSGETFLEAALNIALDTSPVGPPDIRSLGMQNLTLLLDGLDESGSEQEEIAKAAVALVAAYPRCRIVFTTRPIGYETSLLNDWRHYELASIDSSEAKRSVEHLVDAANDLGKTQIKDATAAAIAHLDYTHGHLFSARSPLLIALLASLALNEVFAAATREGLYEQLFNLIEQVSTSKRGITNLTPAVLNAFLQRIGWELTADPHADLTKILGKASKYLEIELDERPLKAQAICYEALDFWEKVGFVERLRFRASEALTFVHKTFGEFAAAKHLCSRSIEERQKLLQAIEPENQWSEVVVFASALGLGPDLVQITLSQDGNDTVRLLRWAKHSREPLSAELSERLLQRVWSVIVGPHSGSALSTGLELLAASSKLPILGSCAKTYLAHPQWWTTLVGWTCFVRVNPDQLEFPALLAFIESYAKDADTRKLTNRFELNRPAHALWAELLLSGSYEAVRRGIGPDEAKFIDHVKGSLGEQSIRFVQKLTSLLKDAGIEVTGLEKEFMGNMFIPEFLERSRQDMLVLLEAISDSSPGDTSSINAPLLHLSAFWYGTGIMEMGISDLVLAAKASGDIEVKQVVGLAARLSSYDYSQLIAEVHTKICTLKSTGDGLLGSFEGLLSVDAPISFHGQHDSNVKPAITRALHHSSEWIVHLATNLAEHLLTAADIAELVPNVLSESNGVGMAAAAHLSTLFLDKELARDLIMSRLKQPLTSGCQHLFRYLADVWSPDLDTQAEEILKQALFFGPRTAQAALQLARTCCEPHRRALSPLLKRAYDYWLQNEEPYPTEGGVIPESPRGEILKLLIQEETVTNEDLFVAALDPRSDVSKPAIDALLVAMSMSETVRHELVSRVQCGEVFDDLLVACLDAHTPFSEQNIQSVALLLESQRPQTRYAASGILDLKYLPASEIRKWAEKLIADPYQRLRDKGHERLSALKCS